jgi:hypothetical protein
MQESRPWKLVAPWYRWERQRAEENRAPRATRPVFQKFDQADFVKGFVKDPQHSLKFDETVDRVFNTTLLAAPPPGSSFPGKLTRLYAPRLKATPKSNMDGVEPQAKDAQLVPTGIRKLYLATHQRFYLVVCELHCDEPGFPTTTRDQVCEAGFAVRRRSFQIPAGAKSEVVKLLKGIVGIQADLAYYQETTPARGLTLKRRSERVKKLKAEGKWEPKVAELKSKLAAARQQVAAWKDANGVASVHEGWLPGEFEQIGSWQLVEETPGQLQESTYPLFSLFPDPNTPGHTAAGKNIYFGVIPTSSHDTDERGVARYDDQSLYEIRCFVRRHKPDCPRREEKPDCPGELFWSEPTESFRFASHNDLIGTSQRPVTIQMPNFQELAAQVAALPLNKFSPVKFVHPQSMIFDVNDGKPEGGSVGFPQICFFSIPLITIIAYFVLSLFLPIVVFLFGLFFLLLLKFCILPSVSIDAELSAELDVVPPSLDVEAGFSLEATVGNSTFSFTEQDLHADLSEGIAADWGIKAAADKDKLKGFSNTPLMELGTKMNSVNKVPEAEAATAGGLDLVATLEYEQRVEAPTA